MGHNTSVKKIGPGKALHTSVAIGTIYNNGLIYPNRSKGSDFEIFVIEGARARHSKKRNG